MFSPPLPPPPPPLTASQQHIAAAQAYLATLVNSPPAMQPQQKIQSAMTTIDGLVGDYMGSLGSSSQSMGRRLLGRRLLQRRQSPPPPPPKSSRPPPPAKSPSPPPPAKRCVPCNEVNHTCGRRQ